MLSFLFGEEGKLSIKKPSFEEFNLVFFTAERMVCFEMQPRQRSFSWIFRYIFHSVVKKITSFKGNLCIYKCFIDVLYIFFFAAKEKLQNAPRFKMDFVLNFAMCLTPFYLRERIQDPDRSKYGTFENE